MFLGEERGQGTLPRTFLCSIQLRRYLGVARGSPMFRMLLTVPIAGGVIVGGGSAIALSGMVGFLGRPDLMASYLETSGPDWGYGTVTFSRMSNQEPCRSS